MKFIDEFKTLNFVGDRELAEQLERMRHEFLQRPAEEYRDSEHYRRKLRDGLRNLADTARDMAHSDNQSLVEQFGQMGRRRFHMAEIQSNGNAEVDAADAVENGTVPKSFDMGAGNEPAVDETPALAAVSA